MHFWAKGWVSGTLPLITKTNVHLTSAQFTRGAIVGSAFVKFLDQPDAMNRLPEFIRSIRKD